MTPFGWFLVANACGGLVLLYGKLALGWHVPGWIGLFALLPLIPP